MKKRLLIAVLVTLCAMTATVSAEEYGYIFKLKPDVVLPFSEPEGVEKIVSDEPVYKADTLEDVYNFVSKSSIEIIAEDEPVYLFDFPEDSPNDTFYYEPNATQDQWYLPIVNIPAVWKKGYRGENSTVCVIDSGLMITHPDIDAERIVGKYNVYSELSQSEYDDLSSKDSQKTEVPQPDDITDNQGHGTFVTGLINAIINNNEGIAGIADKADIISIKSFEKGKSTTIGTLIKALDKAAQYDSIDVINMSLGAPIKSDANKKILKEAVDKVIDKGAIMIAAVGNDGNSVLSYPAAYDNVVGVGAVTEDEEVWAYSQKNESVYVVAPGANIIGLNNSEIVADPDSGEITQYICGGGTSYAAPIVSAVVSIAKSIYRDLTTDELKDILKRTSKDLGDEGYDTSYGYGLIDAEKIINEAEALAANKKPPLFTSENYRRLEYESGKIYVETDDAEADVYIAQYDDNNALKSVRKIKLSETEPDLDDVSKYTIELSDDEKPTKLFLWHGLQGWMSWKEPDVTHEPSASPTAEPDADPYETPYPCADNEERIIEIINNERVLRGSEELVRDKVAMKVTRERITDMFERDYKIDDETGLDIDGKRQGEYLASALTEAKVTGISGLGLNFICVENVYNATAEDIINSVMNNESLRTMAMSSDYTHIGVGGVKDETKDISKWIIYFIKYQYQ